MSTSVATEDPALHGAVHSALAARGVRYTTHRRTLVAALAAAGQPLTIPQLAAAAPSVPQSSIYRNLAIFDDAGVVHRMPGSDDFGRWELAEHLVGHHHHLVCSRCGAVEDVVLPPKVEEELERALQRIARRRGFTLASHRLDLVGNCTSCDAGTG
jgi:Fur family ferric uptake transcriptional regulator